MDPCLIGGMFEPLGSACDGDSIRFRADDPGLWHRVYPGVRSPGACVQVRLEGIDAPETHYGSGPGARLRHLELARQAARELLTWIGFDRVARRADETVVSCGPAGVRGFLLTRFSDSYGRCVALAFRGRMDVPDGTHVPIERDLVLESANYHMLAAGLAYPTFYSMLPDTARHAFAAATAEARASGLGLWPDDVTRSGMPIAPAAAAGAVALPKLWRRVADWTATRGDRIDDEGLRAHLRTLRQGVTVGPSGVRTFFDRLIVVADGRAALAHAPEDLVFDERR